MEPTCMSENKKKIIFIVNPISGTQSKELVLSLLDEKIDKEMYTWEDQSVNEKVMIGRIDQQIKVNKLMIEEVNLWKIANPKLRKYMFNYLEIITVVSTVLCLRSDTEENLMKKRELWSYIKGYDLRLFHHLRRGILGQSMNLPGKSGRKISVAAYKLTQKIVGFN